MRTFLYRFQFLLSLLMVMTCLSIVSANSFRGLNDPKTTVEKNQEEEEGTTNNNDCTPDMTIPFRSQFMEDEIIYEKFYSSMAQKCKSGVVLEIGGLDGYYVSNSWFFEFGLHWTAVMVEPNPAMYERMIKNRPDAINVWNAICWGDKAKFQLTDMEATAGLVDEMTDANKNAAGNGEIIEVPCAKLSDILDQHGIRHVDVFYLDVEGSELMVLETIDWDKVQIDILVIEMSYADLVKNDNIRKHLGNLGYKIPFSMHELCMEKSKQRVREFEGCMPSDIFVREDVWASIQ